MCETSQSASPEGPAEPSLPSDQVILTSSWTLAFGMISRKDLTVKLTELQSLLIQLKPSYSRRLEYSIKILAISCPVLILNGFMREQFQHN